MKRPDDVFEDFVLLLEDLDRRLSVEDEYDRICRELDTDPAAFSAYLYENYGCCGPAVIRCCLQSS